MRGAIPVLHLTGAGRTQRGGELVTGVVPAEEPLRGRREVDSGFGAGTSGHPRCVAPMIGAKAFTPFVNAEGVAPCQRQWKEWRT